MKMWLMIILLLLMAIPVMAADWYVKQGQTGADDGTTYADAWDDLADVVVRPVHPALPFFSLYRSLSRSLSHKRHRLPRSLRPLPCSSSEWPFVHRPLGAGPCLPVRSTIGLSRKSSGSMVVHRALPVLPVSSGSETWHFSALIRANLHPSQSPIDSHLCLFTFKK